MLIGVAAITFLLVVISTPLPSSHQQNAIEDRLKVVENIFCQGFSGDCDGVASIEELQKQRVEAEILRVKKAKEEEEKIFQEEEKKANEQIIIYGKPKNYLPGNTATADVSGVEPIIEGVVVKTGVGSTHNNSRLPSYFPDGLPPEIPGQPLKLEPIQEAKAFTEEEKKKINGTRWQDNVNRFPHQRIQHSPTYSKSKQSSSTTLRAQQQLVETNYSNSIESLFDDLSTDIKHKTDAVPVQVLVQDDGDDDKGQPKLPTNETQQSNRVSSREVADVHHYTGFQPIDLDFNPDDPKTDLFSDIPRKIDCVHRFSFKCLNTTVKLEEENGKQTVQTTQAPIATPLPTVTSTATVAKVVTTTAKPNALNTIQYDKLREELDSLGDELIRTEDGDGGEELLY